MEISTIQLSCICSVSLLVDFQSCIFRKQAAVVVQGGLFLQIQKTQCLTTISPVPMFDLTLISKQIKHLGSLFTSAKNQRVFAKYTRLECSIKVVIYVFIISFLSIL